MATLCLTTHYAIGQATASLEGTIKDATGAVISNAQIIAHNLATGEERKAASDSAGIYALPSLPIGSYRLNLNATGMQSIADCVL
jgi:hypothetical protein